MGARRAFYVEISVTQVVSSTRFRCELGEFHGGEFSSSDNQRGNANRMSSLCFLPLPLGEGRGEGLGTWDPAININNDSVSLFEGGTKQKIELDGPPSFAPQPEPFSQTEKGDHIMLTGSISRV